MAANLSDEDLVSLHRRVPFFMGAAFIFFMIVLIRLYYLQIIEGNHLRDMARQISVRQEETKAPRGLIMDRNHKVLADNRTSYEIVIIPQYLQEKQKTIHALSQLIPMTEEEIEKKIAEAKYSLPFFPVTLVADAPYNWIAPLRQLMRPDYDSNTPFDLQGVEIRTTPTRDYLYPQLFSHVIGYLKEIDKKKMEVMQAKYPDRYTLGDWIGASGIENFYDLDLRGIDGVKTKVVDARGREITGFSETDLLQEETSYAPKQGNHLVTSLDFDAQLAAERAMAGRKGSVVAMDPNTGEILALYSFPGFDANRILQNFDKEYWKKINLDPDKFLFNRAIQATYPPGSIYKIVPAFAGLATGEITPETSYNCGGGMQFGNRYFKCWNKAGHGKVWLVRGISQSCDVFFYQTGLKVGVDRLKEYANKLGFGRKTGVDVPFEQAGLIPSSEWKMKRLKSPWIDSETLSISIGQGYDLVTPLQAANMISTIANGGYAITPHFAKQIIDESGRVIKEIKPAHGEQVVPPEILHYIQEGVINVVQGADGTAKRLQSSPYKIAGKTGTAQVIGHDSKLGMTKERTAHGWFVAFAPIDNPKIAMSVIVENGGSGSGAAAPVALEVINTYLGKIMPIAKTEEKKPEVKKP